MFRPKTDRIEYGGALIGEEEKSAISKVINSQGGKRWTVGPESIAFEQELAANTGVKHAVVVNSGSSALLLSMTALKLKKGSLVAISAVNFPTAFNAIIQCGCVPYVVDADPKTLNINIEQLREAHNLSAVIAVNIASNPVDLKALREIVGDKVKIILDNCDGYGTTINGTYVDTYADLSCVSFHAAHIITTGEGGAVFTNDDTLASTVLKLREWGRAGSTDRKYQFHLLPEDYRERYVYEEIGYNMKPLELQCAMGRIQLKRIQEFKEKRMKNFEALKKVFAKYPQFKTVEHIPAEVCWFSFPIICNGISRGKVMDYLEENNIECRTIFSGNILRHPAYQNIEVVERASLPVADNIMLNGMFLSVHPSVTQEMIDFIDQCIGELCT